MGRIRIAARAHRFPLCITPSGVAVKQRMEQQFTLSYHTLVVAQDIPRLSREWRLRIKKAIEERLTLHPDIFGKPLRRSLAGYRKLRVSDYRIIFRLEHQEVKIIVIAHRRDAYQFLAKRI